MVDTGDPSASDKRRHPRIELYATFTLKALGENFILTVRNLSLGGVLVQADGHDLSTVAVGGEHEVVLVDGENPDVEVAVKARVVRKTADGLAFKWLGQEDMLKVAALLDPHDPAVWAQVRPHRVPAKPNDMGHGLLARLIATLRREPTSVQPLRHVRIKMESLPTPLRAVARDQSESGLMIEAELPWLTVGSKIAAELPEGVKKGRVHWFGVDATRVGLARLRILVNLAPPGSSAVPRAVDRLRGHGLAQSFSWSRLSWQTLMVAMACVVAGGLGGYALRPAQSVLLGSRDEVESARMRPVPAVAIPKAASEPRTAVRPAAPHSALVATARTPAKKKPKHRRHQHHHTHAR